MFSLFQRLTAKSLSENLQPEMSVKFVNGKPIGPCVKTDTPKPKLTRPTPHMTKNFPPVPRNQVDRVNATIGQLLVFKVPVVSEPRPQKPYHFQRTSKIMFQ